MKGVSQIGSFLQVEVKIENIWNHHLVVFQNPSGHTLLSFSQGVLGVQKPILKRYDWKTSE